MAAITGRGEKEEPALFKWTRPAQPGVSRRQAASRSGETGGRMVKIASRFGERPADDRAAFRTEVGLGDLVEAGGAGGQQALHVQVEVFEVELGERDPHRQRLLVDLLVA